jgi:predicted protein tyrosine phosphatase
LSQEFDIFQVAECQTIQWAEIIFVMEKSHRSKLTKKFQPWLKEKRVVCLDIPDK